MSDEGQSPPPVEHEPSDREWPPSDNRGEYAESYWFISDDGKVVVQPPEGDKLLKDPKQPAYVWRIENKIRNETKSYRASGKRETFVIEGRNLVRLHYRFWPTNTYWVEDEEVKKHFADKTLTTTMLKSKSVMLKGRLTLFSR